MVYPCDLAHSNKVKGLSQWNIAWKRFKKNRAALAGAFIIGIVIFIAVFDTLIAKYPPNDLPGFLNNEARFPPSSKYLFGTDYVGHDVFPSGLRRYNT